MEKLMTIFWFKKSIQKKKEKEKLYRLLFETDTYS